MKVSFSLSSSSKPPNSTLRSPSNQHDESATKEFITDFDPSKTPTDSSSNTPFIIPPIPNEWNPQNQAMSSIDLPDDPNLQSGSDPVSSIDRLMLMKLRSDLRRLPDDSGLGEFDNVPVEDFAGAYLKGYGWRQGRGIGKNAKEDVKVVEFRNNAAGEGLGFVRTAGDGDYEIVK
ncbi:hypothetical protein SSX86_022006 [Deinandra increscens subsp. villosa]|uniref:G-patch domain-containing protein n=1 Tax=Deinandra increscens subsp. villosa TaxID=3103831 RepID=A0AAP0GRY8_9ASTR